MSNSEVYAMLAWTKMTSEGIVELQSYLQMRNIYHVNNIAANIFMEHAL